MLQCNEQIFTVILKILLDLWFTEWLLSCPTQWLVNKSCFEQLQHHQYLYILKLTAWLESMPIYLYEESARYLSSILDIQSRYGNV